LRLASWMFWQDYKSCPMIGFLTVPLRFTAFFAFFLLTAAFLLFARFFETFFDFDADFAMDILPGYGVVISWISRIFT
jgi:hypothetical protein